MGQIIYEIISGVPNFSVSLIPSVVSDQIQTSLGVYSFDNVPDGIYSLNIVDAVNCKFSIKININNPCVLEGFLECTLDCSLNGTIECIPDIYTTTTTSTTTEDICQSCPPGYTAVIGSCYKEIIVNPTVPSDPQYLYAKSNIRYGTVGTLVFAEGWNYNGTGTAYTLYNAGSFWKNPLITSIYGSTTDGVMNKNAVWSGVTADYQTVGFPICIDIDEEKVYLVGLGCDNIAEIKVDGTSILMQDADALYTIYTDNGWSIPAPSESTFRLWFIYPVRLTAGKHIIELIGHNTINVAAVGLDIYDMSIDALMACNSYADMGVGLLFSTKNEVGKLVKIGNEGQGYTCPEGYVLGYCDDNPMCYKIDYVPCGTIITVPEVVLTFDDIANATLMLHLIVPTGDVTNVTDWNTYWNLPTAGNSFTEVEVIGNVVKLKGGSSITMIDNIFDNQYVVSLLSIVDASGCIVYCGNQTFGGMNMPINLHTIILPAVTHAGSYFAFSATSLVNLDMHSLVIAQYAAFQSCSSMVNFNLPLLTRAEEFCFAYTTSVTEFNLPSLTYAGDYCFTYQYDSVLNSIILPLAAYIGDRCFYGAFLLQNIYIPSCFNLGTSVADNQVFYYIEDLPVTLTIPAALMTCNAGNPDGDISYLQMQATPLTIIQV